MVQKIYNFSLISSYVIISKLHQAFLGIFKGGHPFVISISLIFLVLCNT